MGLFDTTTKTSQSQQSQFSNQANQTASGQNQGFSQAIESPYFSAFRQSLIPQYRQLFGQSQQPLYGDAQVASFTNNLNSLANSSINSLKAQLAKSGTLDSGALSAGITDINLGNLGQQSNFLSQIPFLNKQSAMQFGGNLLGQGMNFAGRAPISQYNVGQTSGQQNATQSGNASAQGQGTSTTSGLGNLFQGLLGLGAGFGLTKLFGGNKGGGGESTPDLWGGG